MFEELMERVKYYKKLGVNPLALATGCAVKVDLDRVVYPALSELRPKLEKKGLRIAPREDADIFPRTSGGVEVHRRIYTLGPQTNVDPGDVARIGPCRAITVIQVYQRYANQPERFAELVGPVYEKLAEAGVPIHLGKGHSIATPFEEDQFALFDFLKPSGGREEGFTAANNDTMHIIDPTEEPGDYRQVAGALSNTLNDLFVLGVHENLRLALVINAPIEELAEKMRRNAEEFASKLGAEIIEVPQPTRGRLLIGATAIGDTQKHPPTFYGEARPGMKLVATRPFGELAPINVYISAVIDESVVEELEENGITVEELERLKEDAVNRIATPNIGAARVISRYLPDAGEPYDPDQHIAATTDVTGPGIYVVYELAQQMRARIRLHDIPVLYPRLSEYATSTYIIPNATAGTNGAFIAVVPEPVVESFIEDLRAAGLQPVVFGEILGRGEAVVEAPAKLKKYVADTRVLSKFRLVGGGD